MQPIALRDFLNYRYVTGAKLSPDQGKLSFFVTAPNEQKNEYDHSLWCCGIDGANQNKLTACAPSKVALWDGDDRLILAVSPDEALRERVKAGEEWTVFGRVSLSTGEVSEVCRVPYKVTRLQRLQGTLCAALVRYAHGVSGLGECSEQERAERLAAIAAEKDYDVFDELPFWYNGKGIINGVRERIYLLDLADGAMRPVSDEWETVDQMNVRDGEILYTANAYREKKGQSNALWQYRAGDAAPRCLIAQGRMEVQYAARVNGRVLFLASDMKRFGVNENPGFFELTEDGHRLLLDYDLSAKSSVGSDCRMGEGSCFGVLDGSLYFLSTVENHTAICRFTAQNTVERVFERMGCVDEFIVTNDALYFIGLQNDGLPELYRLENGALTAVSSINAEVMQNTRVAKTEWITFPHNGVLIKGGVIFPLDYDPAKRYAGILTIHGGPKAAYGQVFSHEFQMWAAKGYFVFFTNPTGSDGRGNEFADIVGKQGTVDYDQLMAFVDAVLKEYPAIDPARLGVTGGSYGGFMTNWIIGHTNRFACAVAQCSIANWVSKVMTTDIGYYFNTTQLGATPWGDVEKMWFHSPMKYADQVKTPTLFVHGQQDYRCWLAEPVQMFQSLRYHGVESRLVVIHGEHHGMARGKPLHRIRRMQEIIGWFDRYLAPKE